MLSRAHTETVQRPQRRATQRKVPNNTYHLKIYSSASVESARAGNQKGDHRMSASWSEDREEGEQHSCCLFASGCPLPETAPPEEGFLLLSSRESWRPWEN